MAVVGEGVIKVRADTKAAEAAITRLGLEAQAAGKRLNDYEILNGRNITEEMEAIGRAAEAAGATVTKSFSGGKMTALEKEAMKTYDSINALIEKSYYLQSAIASIGPVIADLVAGLFALGSQAAAATPALIVLPSIFAAIGQAALTAKLGLGGVFKAVGELNKAKTGKVDQMPGKLKAFANAQERVRKAQEALNRAYKVAAERIQQLGFDTEDAAIAQQRAALDLEDARATLARVQDLPPNSRARQEAELAFKEADLNYRRAIDRSSDLSAEQDRVTKNGTLNAEQQVAQSDEVVNAQKELKKAVDDLATAQKNLHKSSAGANAGLTQFNQLSPAAKEFAKYIIGLKPKLQELKDAAGSQMFGPLRTAIDNLVTNMFPRLKTILEETGAQLGKTAVDFSKAATSADALKNLDKVGKTNSDTIGKLGGFMGSLYKTFLSLLAAADPLVRRFTDWLVTLGQTISATTEAKNQSGKLTDIFNQAGDVAAQFGRVLKNLGGAFFNMGKAAAGPGSGGQIILDYFEDISSKFKKFTEVASADGSLEEYFRNAGTNFTKIWDFLRKIFDMLFNMGGKKSTFLDSLNKSLDILAPALERLTAGGVSGSFGQFIEQIATFLAATTESGSINMFFGILTKALGALNVVLSNPIAGKILGIAAAAHGARTAFRRLSSTFDTVKEYLTGDKMSLKAAAKKVTDLGKGFKYSYDMMKNVSGSTYKAIGAGLKQAISQTQIYAAYQKIAAGATKAWTVVQRVFNLVLKDNPIGQTILAITVLIAIVVVMYNKFKWFRDFVAVVWSGIKTGAEAVWNAIKAAFDAVWDAISAAISWVWNNVIKPIFNFIGAIWSAEWEGIKTVFNTAWNLISTAISFVWNSVIKPIFNLMGSVFSGIWDGIKKSFTTVWDFIKGAIDKAKDIFGGLGDAIKGAFKTAFNFVADAWNNTIGKIGFKAPKWLGGWEFSVPDIPKMAKGGVVRPVSGGVLTRVAEAGRPERIEPLDANGLSKRDKAMIDYLSNGAAGGITLNVYPSPGMNEVELAALVNRQLAFALRKGAA